ncbi:MAG TPA: hypothetical protein VGE98_09535, partial [Thermoanaerobaculia bacterium]
VPVWADSPHPITIAAARAMAVGSTVTVEGTVTVASGTFASSFFDEGFAIQDRTGGIYVSTANNLNLHLREAARVTGVLQDSSGLLVLVPASDSDVDSRDHGRRVHSILVHTGNVGPANQGRIVTILGKVTEAIEPDPPFGSKLFVDDGSGAIRVFLNSSTNIDPTRFAEGDLVLVTGFSSAFETPELDPRGNFDLEVLHRRHH